jgi:cobalt-precorrin-6B (C15)-methyltransferase
LKYREVDVPEETMTVHPAGGETADEVLAIDLWKLGLRPGDHVVEIGCGSGKVTVALATRVRAVSAVDRNPDAIRAAKNRSDEARLANISFYPEHGVDFLVRHDGFDCAFIGGSHRLAEVLPLLAERVDRTIVVNAVLLSTLHTAIAGMRKLGIFREAIQVQVGRSHPIAGDFMWKPIDPVFIVVGGRSGCS